MSPFRPSITTAGGVFRGRHINFVYSPVSMLSNRRQPVGGRSGGWVSALAYLGCIMDDDTGKRLPRWRANLRARLEAEGIDLEAVDKARWRLVRRLLILCGILGIVAIVLFLLAFVVLPAFGIH